MALPRLQPVPAVCTGPGTVRTRCPPAPRDHSAEPAPASPLRADRVAGARLCSVWQRASGWLSVPALALSSLTKMSGQKVRCPWSSGPPFSAWRSRGVARLPTPAACVLRPKFSGSATACSSGSLEAGWAAWGARAAHGDYARGNSTTSHHATRRSPPAGAGRLPPLPPPPPLQSRLLAPPAPSMYVGAPGPRRPAHSSG